MHVFRGTDIAAKILNDAKRILVYYDPDVDGIFSGYFVTDVLSAYNVPNIYYINENREHGFRMNLKYLEKLQGYTIVAVDFSIEDDIFKAIVDSGISIVNIDHHDISHEELFYYENAELGSRGVVINNQYCFEPAEWRFLSGAGVVHSVFSAFMPEYFNTKKHRALVGLTLLSDVRETESDLAIEYLKDTYSWRDEYSDYLIANTVDERKMSFGAQVHLDRNYVDFTFSPKINAMFRFNLGDAAVEFVKGNLPEGLNLSALREQQKDISNDIVNNAECNIYSALTVATVAYDPTVNLSNFVGLACSRLLSDTEKTTITMLCDGTKVIRGSVRGRSDNINYLEIFRRYGVPCAGHKNAFGVKPCDLATIDFEKINGEIALAEATDKATYTITPIGNLGLAIAESKKARKIAEYNSYARNNHRIYWDCSRCCSKMISHNGKGTFVKYLIDGVEARCFDINITPDTNGVILPLMEKGYIVLYLRRAGV
jgi:single-stranded DNA-specific DHH superfamily exonuclease